MTHASLTNMTQYTKPHTNTTGTREQINRHSARGGRDTHEQIRGDEYTNANGNANGEALLFVISVCGLTSFSRP